MFEIRRGRIAQHIAKVGEETVCTSILVAAELRYGSAKRNSSRLTAQLEAILGVMDVLPLRSPADATYGLLRVQLEQIGTTFGANDLLIAAQAVKLGHVLVTDNEREFRRVHQLKCENWLRAE